MQDCPSGFVDADMLKDALHRFFPCGSEYFIDIVTKPVSLFASPLRAIPCLVVTGSAVVHDAHATNV